MTTFLLFVIVWAAGSILQSFFRRIPKPRKRKTAAAKPPAATVEYKPLATCQEKTPENNAVLNALAESRNTIIDSISER